MSVHSIHVATNSKSTLGMTLSSRSRSPSCTRPSFQSSRPQKKTTVCPLRTTTTIVPTPPTTPASQVPMASRARTSNSPTTPSCPRQCPRPWRTSIPTNISSGSLRRRHSRSSRASHITTHRNTHNHTHRGASRRNMLPLLLLLSPCLHRVCQRSTLPLPSFRRLSHHLR